MAKKRKFIEYRIAVPIDYEALGRSVLARTHSGAHLRLTVRRIFKTPGVDPSIEHVSKNHTVLECSVTDIHNDKKPDGMVLISGWCLTKRAPFEKAVLCRDFDDDGNYGYGLITLQQ